MADVATAFHQTASPVNPSQIHTIIVWKSEYNFVPFTFIGNNSICQKQIEGMQQDIRHQHVFMCNHSPHWFSLYLKLQPTYHTEWWPGASTAICSCSVTANVSLTLLLVHRSPLSCIFYSLTWINNITSVANPISNITSFCRRGVNIFVSAC